MQDPNEWSSQKSSEHLSLQQTGQTLLTPENVKDLFTRALRTGVEQYITCLGALDLTSEQGVYREALKFAILTYDSVVAKLLSALDYLTGSDTISFPLANTLTPSIVEGFYIAIKANEKILGDGVEMHLASDQSRGSEYLRDFHKRARERIAGSWAEAARAITDLMELLRQATRPTFQEQIRAQSAQQEGRDIPGRVAYYLMNIPVLAITESLIGFDPKEGAERLRGMARLALDLANAFSDAACHNDARQMCDLLSRSKFAEGKTVAPDKLTVEKTAHIIFSQIQSCSAPRKILKLTNFANHSVVYLISGQKGIRYESIAAQNSMTILYNDLIRYPVSETDLKQMVDAGVEAIAQGGENTLEWEVHEATTLEDLQHRLYRRLRDGTSEISFGLCLAAYEKMKDLRTMGAMETHGLTLENYKIIPIPLSIINQGSDICLYNYFNSGQSDLMALMNGQRYRIKVRKRWMCVTYQGLIDATHLPVWMNVCGSFLIEDVDIKYERAQLREPNEQAGEVVTTMMNFVFQVIKMASIRNALFTPQSADYPKEYAGYVIVEDPFWENGGNARKIIYRKKD